MRCLTELELQELGSNADRWAIWLACLAQQMAQS